MKSGDGYSRAESAYGSMKTMEEYTSSTGDTSVVSSSLFGASEKASASTSGCSSAAPTWFRQKKEKKEKVKKCLEELKSLMPSLGEKGTRQGTLSTLQQVLSHMKKMSDQGQQACSPKPQTQMDADIELLGGHGNADPLLGGVDPKQMLPEMVDTQEWHRIVLSVKENIVLQISPELLDMLGYPRAKDMQDYTKNYLFNQSLFDYVYKKDATTVATNLSACQGQKTMPTDGPDENGSKGFFFFRLRHFKSLRQGFSLNRPVKYSVFCARACVQKVELNFPPGTPAEGLQPDSNYIVLECKPMVSAYVSKDVLPEQKAFMTRHTLFCNFNFMHPSMIPLLGYLPQDFIGTSVFDYYHPDDLQLLWPIYQQVVQNPGKTIHSRPYRMRAKNGDFVTLETEWSGFANPWTKLLDFIMGHHTVVRGPQNIDVLAESGKKQLMELTSQDRLMQRAIRTLLLEHVSMTEFGGLGSPKSTSVDMKLEASHEEGIQEDPTPKSPENFVEDTGNMSVEISPQEDVDSSEEIKSGSSPTSSILENEKARMYQQLSYTQNIRRYLLSYASEGGEGSHVRSSSNSNEESDFTEEEGLAMDMMEVKVDINLQHVQKPPSFASSTKALVSEQEREELMPPSPSHEEVHEESHQKEAVADDVYEHKSLTEGLLQMHNKLQEQMYLERLASGKALLMPGEKNEGKGSVEKISKKRIHGSIEEQSNKFMRQNDGQAVTHQTLLSPTDMLTPPFPLTTGPALNPDLPKVPALQSEPPVVSSVSRVVTAVSSSVPVSVMSVSVPTTQSLLTYSTGGTGPSPPQTLVHVPMVVTTAEATATPPSTGEPPTSTQVPWMYYTNSGYPLMLYNPATGVFQQLTTQSVLQPTFSCPISSVASSRKKQSKCVPSHHKPKKSAASGSSKENEASDSNSLETSSSLMYLLDSEGNGNTNSGSGGSEEEEERPCPTKLPVDPPWVQTVNWSSELQNQYTIPEKDMKRRLNEDRKALAKMSQPDLVSEQLLCLLGDLQEERDYPVDEEADLCFFVEEKEACNKKPSATSVNPHFARSLPQIKEDLVEPMSEVYISEKIAWSYLPSGSDDVGFGDVDLEVEEVATCTMLDENQTTKDCQLPFPNETSLNSKSSCGSDKTEIDSDFSDTAWSKDSSCITPSDQRSNEEAGSSMKESDSMSLDSGSAKDVKSNPPSESDSDACVAKDWFSQLFVPLVIKCEQDALIKDASWLQEVDFNEAVQMKYQVPRKDLKTVLSDDKIKLLKITQPELVKKQMTHLLNDIRKPQVQVSKERRHDGNLKVKDMETACIQEKSPDDINDAKDADLHNSTDFFMVNMDTECMSLSEDSAQQSGQDCKKSDGTWLKDPTCSLGGSPVSNGGSIGDMDSRSKKCSTPDTGHGTESNSETDPAILRSASEVSSGFGNSPPQNIYFDELPVSSMQLESSTEVGLTACSSASQPENPIFDRDKNTNYVEKNELGSSPDKVSFISGEVLCVSSDEERENGKGILNGMDVMDELFTADHNIHI